MNQPTYRLTGVIRTKEELLEDFEGPLDVILLLLSKNKIEISDISITSILEQYLAYLDEMQRMDMEIASEFIIMASHLMQIKTKMLLSYSEQTEAQSEMEALMESLRMRRNAGLRERLQVAVSALERRNELGLGMFVKVPEPFVPDGTYRYQHSPEDLVRAMQAMGERAERRLPPPVSAFAGVVGRPRYPVSKKAAQLLRNLMIQGTSRFRALFGKCRSRSEVVATFLAVLDLCRTRCITLLDGAGEPTVRFEQLPADELHTEFE